jgi:hypothetical protein
MASVQSTAFNFNSFGSIQLRERSCLLGQKKIYGKAILVYIREDQIELFGALTLLHSFKSLEVEQKYFPCNSGEISFIFREEKSISNKRKMLNLQISLFQDELPAILLNNIRYNTKKFQTNNFIFFLFDNDLVKIIGRQNFLIVKNENKVVPTNELRIPHIRGFYKEINICRIISTKDAELYIESDFAIEDGTPALYDGLICGIFSGTTHIERNIIQEFHAKIGHLFSNDEDACICDSCTKNNSKCPSASKFVTVYVCLSVQNIVEEIMEIPELKLKYDNQ